MLTFNLALGLGTLRSLNVRGNSTHTNEGAYSATLGSNFSFLNQKLFLGGFRETTSRLC